MSASIGSLLMPAKATINYVLWAMLFCYAPHLISSPWWLSVIIIAAISYRLVANYFNFPLPNVLIRVLLIIAGLCLLFWHYQMLRTSGFYIGFLLIFTALKGLEVHTVRDLRVLLLCNLYVMLTVLLMNQTLWIFLYTVVGILVNLMLMIILVTPAVDFKHTGKSLFKHFLLAIPLSLLLFYLFPRFSHPLWQVPALSQNKMGFNEEMKFGDFSDSFDDDSTAMRIVINQKVKPSLYWRGLVLSHFNGLSWTSETVEERQFSLLKSMETRELANYEVVLEPHQKKWLFYQDNPVASKPKLKFSSSLGLLQQDNSRIYQRFDYSIVEKPTVYQPLTQTSIQQNTNLPTNDNPRLKAWAKQQYAAVGGSVHAFIDTIAYKISTEPFWYSLSNQNTGIKANLMDSFWFETKRGYCEHYASAVAIALRAVGVPARVIVGYHGGTWNPMAHYLTVKQNDAHAWVEYWQNGSGWQSLDPVTFIAPDRIDPAIKQKQFEATTQDWLAQWSQGNVSLSWTSSLAFWFESTQFFWERWLLFYNQDSQKALLQMIGFDHWDEIKLMQAFIVLLVILLVVGSVGYVFVQRTKRDELLVEYSRLQKEMHRLEVSTKPPATFIQQLHDLSIKQPHLKETLRRCAQQYELLRLQQVNSSSENRQAILPIIKKLRKRLSMISVQKK